MKINTIQLRGYNRFPLDDISEFALEASSTIQIVLGTNGCGKSSLLEALSPYPQPSSDFRKGGFKLLEIEHNNNIYTLVSDYNASAKHQFIKNGINVNEGGTASVQKQLVEKELGFSQAIHDLLTGKVTFCEMLPSQRREWITKISTVDLEYALKVHDSIKTRLRDSQGALKHYQTRLASESQKIISDVDIDALHRENDTLQQRISFYLTHKKANMPNQTDVEYEYESLSKTIEALSLKVLKTEFSYPEKSKVKTLEQIMDIENALVAKEKAIYAVIEELQSQLSEDEITLNQLQKEGAIDQKGLENKLSTLYEALSNMGPLNPELDLGDYSQEARADLKGVRLNLSELVAECSGPTLSVIDKSGWDKAALELKVIDSRLFDLKRKVTHLCKRKEDIESVRENQCPNCQYVWKPGFSEQELDNLNDEIKDLNGQIYNVERMLDECKEICQNIDTRKGEIEKFKALSQSYPRLRNFWQYIAEHKYLYTNPNEIMYQWDNWLRELNRKISLDTLHHEIDMVKSTLNRLENIGEKADIDYFVKKQNALTNKINAHYLSLEKHGQSMKSIRLYKKQYLALAEDLSQLVRAIARLKELETSILDGKMQQEINTRLGTSQMSLANNQRAITEAQTLSGIIEDLKTNIDSLSLDIEALKAIEQSLCPSKGLIAKVLSDFINKFLIQLNIFIKKVWDYDMAILSCSLENAQLDYRFPMEIQKQLTTISDISKASDGQKEIINLAFMLAIMAHLDLKDYPLFLDEIGSAFDQTHQSKSADFIKWLIETNQCSQIWLATHSAIDHGGLKDSQICVLNANNISVPQVYNQHVSIS